MTRCQTLLHRWRECYASALHSQRRADAGLNQRFVVRSRAKGKGLPQQRFSEIRILKSGTYCALKLIFSQKLVQLSDRIVRVRIQGIHGVDIERHSRQAGSVRGQVVECDLFAIELRHPCSGRQELRNRIQQSDFFPFHHVGQQQRRKDLRDRTDFKDRVAIYRACISRSPMSVSNDSLPPGFDQPYDNSDGLAVFVDALGKDVSNLGIRNACSSGLRVRTLEKYGEYES